MVEYTTGRWEMSNTDDDGVVHRYWVDVQVHDHTAMHCTALLRVGVNDMNPGSAEHQGNLFDNSCIVARLDSKGYKYVSGAMDGDEPWEIAGPFAGLKFGWFAREVTQRSSEWNGDILSSQKVYLYNLDTLEVVTSFVIYLRKDGVLYLSSVIYPTREAGGIYFNKEVETRLSKEIRRLGEFDPGYLERIARGVAVVLTEIMEHQKGARDRWGAELESFIAKYEIRNTEKDRLELEGQKRLGLWLRHGEDRKDENGRPIAMTFRIEILEHWHAERGACHVESEAQVNDYPKMRHGHVINVRCYDAILHDAGYRYVGTGA